MAYKNKFIHNPVTGQSIRFLQTAKDTGGQLLEMESVYGRNSVEPAPHYHPVQEEIFMVVAGEITISINGAAKVHQAGETIYIKRKTVHSMWNASGVKTVLNWKVQPALDTEYFLENVTGLAIDGKTNKSGMPGLLQVALIANRFSNIFRLAKPSFMIQKIVFNILAPFAYLKGLKPAYKKYEN